MAWLDASVDEQRRVREIVSLFSTKDTLDEVGGRRIVVVFSDALFPGTSVLHARARYLLFIPWLCQVAATRKRPAQALDQLERRLIGAFLEQRGELDITRLIGRQSGIAIRQLPSTAYWSALTRWGILAWPGTIAETLHRSSPRAAGRALAEEAAVDELAGRQPVVWHEGARGIPPGFPETDLAGGFDLTFDEATWLRERLLATTDGSLLGHLAGRADRLSDQADGAFPWTEPACRTVPKPVLAVLDDAERFALAVDGARLLYNLLVAERYRDRGFTSPNVDPAAYRDNLAAWADDATDRRALFDGWRPHDFWRFVRERNPAVDQWTQQFFDLWFARLTRGDLDGVADDAELRSQVTDRERLLKRGQARLSNDRLLASWTGGGSAPTAYRWAVVQTLVTDIIDGLEHGRAGA